LCNLCCSGKAIHNTYSESVFVASGIQHAMRARHIHLWPARLYIIFLYRKLHDFRKKVVEHTMCFDFLYNVCAKHSSL